MTPTIREIQKRTASATGVPLSDIMSHRRDGPTTRARQIAMYAARLLTPFSLPQIGQAFNRDHTTVLYTVRRIESRIYGEPDLVAAIRKVCTIDPPKQDAVSRATSTPPAAEASS